MKNNNYKKFSASNWLLPLIFTGQFLSMALFYLLKIPGLYFLIFAIALIYAAKIIFQRHSFHTVNSLDLFWVSYFILSLASAGLFGHGNFLNFSIIFITQAIIPFYLGRVLRENCNARRINFYLNLLFAAYLGILILLFLQDPSNFFSDRFYPFLDKYAENVGGDPTQSFLGYGLAAILLSNYFMVRSKNEEFSKHGLLKIFIIFNCIFLFFIVASRSSIIALLLIIFANEYGSKKPHRKFFYLLPGAVVLVGFFIKLFSDERLNFITELMVIFNLGDKNLACIDEVDGSILYRVSGIFQSLILFLDNPIFGVGVGNYGWFYCGVKGDFIYPHNIILQIMSELGLIGMTIFCLCLYKTYKANVKFLCFYDDSIHGDVTKLFFNYWIFCLLIAIFSGNSYSDILFYLLSGMVSKKFCVDKFKINKNNPHCANGNSPSFVRGSEVEMSRSHSLRLLRGESVQTMLGRR
jgi:O-antigen ligase